MTFEDEMGICKGGEGWLTGGQSEGQGWGEEGSAGGVECMDTPTGVKSKQTADTDG